MRISGKLASLKYKYSKRKKKKKKTSKAIRKGIMIINKFTFYQYLCARLRFVSCYDFVKRCATVCAKTQIYRYPVRFFFFLIAYFSLIIYY